MISAMISARQAMISARQAMISDRDSCSNSSVSQDITAQGLDMFQVLPLDLSQVITKLRAGPNPNPNRDCCLAQTNPTSFQVSSASFSSNTYLLALALTGNPNRNRNPTHAATQMLMGRCYSCTCAVWCRPG